eukprot:scaffold845_cov364-Prasinococcus_capsulatus_cf.AAC.29
MATGCRGPCNHRSTKDSDRLLELSRCSIGQVYSYVTGKVRLRPDIRCATAIYSRVPATTTN